MVKRTLVVLGILSLMAGTCMAQQSWISGFPGDCGTGCAPLYVPCECPPVPESRTIIKTWSCKIEGPCPPPGAPCGPAACKDDGFNLGKLLFLAGGIATPFDWLFGGMDGLYGCDDGSNKCSPCGPCFGPIPGLIHGVLAAVSPPPVMFGCYW